MCAGQGVTLPGLWSSSSLSREDQQWVAFLSGHEDSVLGKALQSRISPSPQQGGRAPLRQAQLCPESQPCHLEQAAMSTSRREASDLYLPCPIRRPLAARGASTMVWNSGTQ